MTSKDDLTRATSIAIEAGHILTSYFRSDAMDARAKGERDVVTRADTESEALVAERLRAAFPSDALVGEEGANRSSGGTRRWFIDPLDGTLNYSHGLPLWCVSLALFEGNQPVLGVVHDPLRDETFTALAGQGAWLNGQILATSGETRMEEALVHLTIDFHETSLLAGLRDIQALAPRVLRTRNIGSAALALAYIAAGHLDAMVHRMANAWDYGAGVLLVREAGGRVTDMGGAPYTVETVALVAGATQGLQEAVRRTLRVPVELEG